MGLLAAAANTWVQGQVLTFAIPLGVFAAVLFWGFFQRRRYP
ncbi:MAG: hypothetical protein ACRDYD_03015 [Acidimicrobiales bacterium]